MGVPVGFIDAAVFPTATVFKLIIAQGLARRWGAPIHAAEVTC